MTSVQTVLIPRSRFTERQALEWLKNNGYKHNKVDYTTNYMRWRQEPPKKGYKYYTVRLNNGIDIVYQHT